MFCPNGVSTAVLIPLSGIDLEKGAVRITTNGSCYLRFGDAAVVATGNDISCINNVVSEFKVPAGATHVSAIAPTNTPTLRLTIGQNT